MGPDALLRVVLAIEQRAAPGAVHQLRLWTLALMLTPWPLLLGSLLASDGLLSPFGLTLLGTSAGLLALAVPLIPPVVLMGRTMEIGREGVRIVARFGSGHLPWTTFRRVRVVSGRPAGSPFVTFIFGGLRATLPVAVDASKDPEAAERVASAIAQYAPRLRRTGDVGRVRWESAGRADGSYTCVQSFEGPLSRLFALCLAIAALSMDLPVWLGPELFPSEGYRTPVAAAYLAIVALTALVAWRKTGAPSGSGGGLRGSPLANWPRALSLLFVALAGLILVSVATA